MGRQLGGNVLRHVALALLLAFALTATIPAPAQANAILITFKAESLAEALQDIARQSGVELLFDHNAVAGTQAQALTATLSPEAAILQLLQGTELILRQAASGAFIVEQPAPPPLERQDVTVPEILVIGLHSQNADIRRVENDIQPYRVTTGRQINDADRDNLDQYFRSQVTSDTDAVPPSLTVNGATNSQIDLRGLGPDQTLVLIDGRRMPSIPEPVFGFHQTDINAVPLYAIDRVETLTGTAGGIYGFGALGGVVNVVLAHPSQGIEVHTTGGISARGDAGGYTLEGDAGFSPNDRTEISLHVGLSGSQPLLYGQRTFFSQDTKLTANASPTTLLPFEANGNSVLVQNTDGPLVFKPQFGGGALGSTYTFLPAGSSGAPAAVAAALTQNAGKFDSSLPDGTASSDIGSNPRTVALLANIRHQFDGDVEAYLDAVILRDDGEFLGHAATGQTILSASSPLNPFTQDVQIEFPVPGASLDRKSEFYSARYTAGAIAPLPFDWRATAELALGAAHYQFSQVQVYYAPPFTAPAPAAFGDWASFQAGLASQLANQTSSERITNNFRDLSLRLAGPVFETQTGPATLTLLGERRIEDVPEYTNFATIAQSASPTSIASRETATTSVYAELRTRVFGEAPPIPLLRNFEVQLAIRNDTETDDFASDPQAPDTTQRLHDRFSGTVYTAGAKLSPVSWLGLRGSYATGATAPPLADLIETDVNYVNFVPVDDPQRPGYITQNTLVKSGGSPDLQTIKANTASFGGILTPVGEAGPRLTLDYSRIRRTGDVFMPSAELVLDNEAFWPQRVVRGPLTDADRALGYTAGPITMIDARAENGAGLKADTIEGRLDWPLPFFFDGTLRLHSDATYYLRNVQSAPFQADIENVGYLNEPLSVRANAGATWEFDSLTFGINVQYFGSYRIIPPAALQFEAATAIALQGSDRVPSQTYADLHASWRHHLNVGNSSEDIKIDFGVINIFDKEPPRESSYSLAQFTGPQFGNPGFSRYGDPRLRRFLLTLSVAR